jgi:large subunit ribosomal protein L4
MGPRARSHRQRLSRRLKKDALREALSVQAQAEAVMLIEPFALTEAKTRLLASLLEALGAQGPALLVLEKPDPVLWRCGRNLAGFVVKGADDVSAYEVLRARKVIITTDALTRLEARAS